MSVVHIRDLSTLTSDGDTLELADGRLLRLREEPDYDASINDNDCYGRVNMERIRTNDLGWEIRPEGFTGNAEKLWYGNDGPWWWEPYANIKRGTPEFDEMRQQVREILAFGFKGLILELCEGTDYYGKPIVVNSTSVWGIEAMTDRKYIQDIVSELADELEVTS